MSTLRASDALVPFHVLPAAISTVSAVRSTLVTTSLQVLRARGLYDRYARNLDEAVRSSVISTVAGTWLPLSAAIAHYRACDGLGLSSADQLAIAMDVGDRVHGTFLGMLVRLAREAGVTPWPALAQSARLHRRLFCGGGIEVVERGPKDAQVQMVGNPLCAIGYFRVGVRGIYQAGLRLFCHHASTSEVTAMRGSSSLALRISWV